MLGDLEASWNVPEFSEPILGRCMQTTCLPVEILDYWLKLQFDSSCAKSHYWEHDEEQAVADGQGAYVLCSEPKQRTLTALALD